MTALSVAADVTTSITTLDWITLSVAGLGVALGVASLAWQAWTWRRSGPHVDVKTGAAMVPYVGDHVSDVVSVEARNKGRAATQITGWGLDLDDKRQFVFTQDLPGNTPLPTTIEPGHRAIWMVPIAFLNRDNLPDGANLGVRGFVHLGSGDRRRGNRLEVSKDRIRDEPNPFG